MRNFDKKQRFRNYPGSIEKSIKITMMETRMDNPELIIGNHDYSAIKAFRKEVHQRTKKKTRHMKIESGE